MNSKLTALTLLSALLSAPLAHADEAKDARLARQLNLTKASLRHQGRDRTFYYHGRINQRSKALKPVLFVLHGGGGSGPDTANKTGYNPVAQDNGFLVVYPNGWQGNWNDGRGKPAATGVDVSNIDDVGFFRKLFDYTAQTLKGDPQRFYVTGLSNGGTMSYRLGIELTDRIAAIAPVIANLTGPLQTATPKRPLPVLIMNGTADPLMHWGGSTNPDGSVAQLSTPETVTWWIRHNAQRRLVLPRSEHLPNVNRQDDSTVEVTTYTGLVAPVVLYTIHGGGHTFPGSDVKDVPQLVGAKNMDIDGREEVWAFVSQFKLD
ncbi:MAG: esterase [Planctomycetota bacterium]